MFDISHFPSASVSPCIIDTMDIAIIGTWKLEKLYTLHSLNYELYRRINVVSYIHNASFQNKKLKNNICMKDLNANYLNSYSCYANAVAFYQKKSCKEYRIL